MSQEQYSPIRFQLEESIWLDHHSKHAEIISLELEPDIEVVEERDYISITGSLVLNGRFEPVNEDGEEGFDLESSSLAEQLHFQPLRVEQKELYEEDLRGKIEKRFPLDVAVPTQKIDNLDDVYVLVEQLDYSVTDGHRLNIVAEVMISGIKSEAALPVESAESRMEETQEEQTKDEQKREKAFQPPLFPAFDIAASKDEVNRTDNEEPEQTDAEFTEDERPLEVFEVSTKQQDTLEGFPRVDEGEDRVDLTRLLSKESSYSKPEEQQVQSNGGKQSRALKGESEDKVVPLFDNEIRTVFHSLPTNDPISADEDDERQDEESVSQTTSFLTKLMAGAEDDESRFAKLKVCIVQKDESLDLISDRYSVPIRDIVRANRLESEQVSEGQIIYIPTN